MSNARLLHRMAPALGLAIALLSGCKPPPPPVTTMEGRACVPQPLLESAAPVKLDGDTVRVVLDETAGCWHPPAGAASAYVVFRLPQAAEPYILTIVSEPIGFGLLSPRAQLLDGGGTVLREIQPDSFLSQGPALKAGLRARPGEQFLVVTSDAGAVGQNKSEIANVLNQHVVVTGRYATSVNVGSERLRTQTYAHNGVILVKAEPLPPTQAR
jgi:hypothetical protein